MSRPSAQAIRAIPYLPRGIHVYLGGPNLAHGTGTSQGRGKLSRDVWSIGLSSFRKGLSSTLLYPPRFEKVEGSGDI